MIMEDADPFLSALIVAEDVLAPYNDEQLADGLQLQEVLVASITKPKWQCAVADGAGEQSCSEPFCVVCERTLTPADVLQKDTCRHAFCGVCLHRHIDEEIQRGTSMVQCPHASCKAMLEPELCREFVPPKLFNRWLDVHQNERTVRVGETVDPKGKNVIECRELGESSGVQENADEFFCNICMEQKPLDECFSIKSCSHNFCSDCISHYIEAKVEENITSIACPDLGCGDGTLDPKECREILAPAVFDRWGLALCEIALGTKKFYCPYNDCSALLINDGDREVLVKDAQCPHCSRVFCAQCKVPWHEGIDCEGFQKLGDDERAKEDLLVRKMAIESKWQRCPQCKIYVEKIEGCLFVKCRCGYCFCYVCASLMSAESHFCQKCQRTW